MQHFTSFSFKFKFILLVKRACLLKYTFFMEILHLISRVLLASFVIMLPKQLKYFTFFSYFLSVICIWDGYLRFLLSQFFPNSFPFQWVGQRCPYSDCLRAGRSGNRISVGRDFPRQSRPTLRPTQPPVKWVPRLSRG